MEHCAIEVESVARCFRCPHVCNCYPLQDGCAHHSSHTVTVKEAVSCRLFDIHWYTVQIYLISCRGFGFCYIGYLSIGWFLHQSFLQGFGLESRLGGFWPCGRCPKLARRFGPPGALTRAQLSHGSSLMQPGSGTAFTPNQGGTGLGHK